MSVKKLLGAATLQGLLLAMLTLLALLAVSSLMLQRGLLPESAAPSMVCVACAAAVFAGGRRAVRKGRAALCRRRRLWRCVCTPHYGLLRWAVRRSFPFTALP